MPENTSASSVNVNYLDKVMDLAEHKSIEATEDIFDSKGTKLLAKGAKISRNLQEKLVLHKLSKPLEACIRVEDGVDTITIASESKRLIEEVVPIQFMHHAVQDRGESPINIIERISFGNAMGLMLTIIDRGGPAALAHCAAVSLVSICLAKKLDLSDEDQAIVGLAGLLHDIGELYIAPEYLTKRSQRLSPDEWRHVVVHPRVGEMLIRQHEKCAPEVATAVAEHHERFDAGGYPRQIGGKAFGVHGQILSVAEAMSGIFARKDRQLERAELALKIIPGEHSTELVSAVSSIFRLSQRELVSNAEQTAIEDQQAKVAGLFNCLSDAFALGGTLLDSGTIRSKPAKELLHRALIQIGGVMRAFSSTGLDRCIDEGVLPTTDLAIQFEVEVASNEIVWRLRDIARNIALHCVTLDPVENAALQSLIVVLDEGKAR